MTIANQPPGAQNQFRLKTYTGKLAAQNRCNVENTPSPQTSTTRETREQDGGLGDWGLDY